MSNDILSNKKKGEQQETWWVWRFSMVGLGTVWMNNTGPSLVYSRVKGASWSEQMKSHTSKDSPLS